MDTPSAGTMKMRRKHLGNGRWAVEAYGYHFRDGWVPARFRDRVYRMVVECPLPLPKVVRDWFFDHLKD